MSQRELALMLIWTLLLGTAGINELCRRHWQLGTVLLGIPAAFWFALLFGVPQ